MCHRRASASFLFAIFALGIILASTRLARAQERTASVALDWSAPSECPSRESVLEEVSRLLHRPLVAIEPPALRVHAELTQLENGQYRVVLRTESADGVGQREIDEPACSRIGEAAAVVIALAIDPDALTRPSPSSSPSLSPSPSPPPIVPPASNVRVRAIHFALAALVLGDIGTLPQPSVGAGLTLSILFRSLLRFELLASTWYPQDIPSGNALPGGAHLEMLFLGGARGCIEHSFHWLELGACVGFLTGALKSTGFGISNPNEAISIWMDVSAGGSIAVRLSSWFALRLFIDGAYVVNRPSFTVQTSRGGIATDLLVYQTPEVVTRSALAAEFRF